ncbi:hypothetical protein DFH94DRAFT_843453 [Russula ochroleuca]|uniref:SnoaL-like domain-containing protein n=1 Tax=Russula ochroleuca TaxID=152965 RepID=A0A9P5N1L4_9AGAM|nr:hypothetical protein DFH94DRAFT_843453 [Russula ochroleuca]
MVTTFEVPKSPSPQLKTVLDYLDHVKVLDLAEIEKLFTDDFVQSTSPHTLNVPPRTKQEDLAFLRGLSEQLEGRHLQMTVYDIVEAPGKAWVHLLLHVEFPDGRTFDIECIYQITLVGHLESHKIKAINDFVDTAAFAAMCG